VPRSPGARTKRTVPAWLTLLPSTDRHEMLESGTSSVISASH
jgi:hypothetical protein